MAVGSSPAAGGIAERVSERAAPAVCAGVPGCRVVARVDVTGDGDRDVVALARRGKDGAERGAVLVRVRTPEGRLASARRKTRLWNGSLWQGLDGSTAGPDVTLWSAGCRARTPATSRCSPGGTAPWSTSTARAAALLGGGRVGRKRLAIRQGDATAGPFRGEVTSYRWTRAGWDLIARRVVDPLADERAARWAGWRLPGVDRW